MKNLERITTYLEGAKNRLRYDYSMALAKLLYRAILPYYLENRRIFYTIYTEIKCKKLYRFAKFAGIDEHRYSDIKIIKFGKTEFVPFGKLYKLFPESDDVDEVFASLESTLKDITKEDVVVLCGFDILIALKGLDALQGLKNLYESLPDCTLFLTSRNMFGDAIDKLLIEFHDNTIILSKEEFSGSFRIEFEDGAVVIPSFELE